MIELTTIRRSVAARELFSDINLIIQDTGVRAIIGRNGEGKSTILKIIAGIDNDFEGKRRISKSTTIAYSAQQHTASNQESALDYIREQLPEYSTLNTIIENGEQYLSGGDREIALYSDAIERFSSLNYFDIDNTIERLCETVGLAYEKLALPYVSLSGGQQKLVDLVMVMASPATTLLFDEPTNHMDYVAKAKFVDWLRAQKASIVIVTHDRDVLDAVNEIYELKDRKLLLFPGNYADYLRQNRVKTSSSIHQYEIDMRSLDNLKKQLVEARRKKDKCKSNPNPFVPLVDRLEREYKKIEAELEKPTAWIDAKSIATLKPDEKKRYEKFKSRNIKLHSEHTSHRGSGAMLIDCSEVSLGYDGAALFQPITFRVNRGERVRIVGRNGAGKTTLINAITSVVLASPFEGQILSGKITSAPLLSVAEYKQHGEDIDNEKTLFSIIQDILKDHDQTHDETTVRKTLARFMFHPVDDGEKPYEVLSGGEKARINLFTILTKKPDVMILDEPTNHLDLPSIEELEKLLHTYNGAVLYVSHDSYFASEIGGTQVVLENGVY